MWAVHLTGNAVYDALGSITIGGLLGCTAVFLIQQNRSLLLGAISQFSTAPPVCHAWQNFQHSTSHMPCMAQPAEHETPRLCCEAEIGSQRSLIT